MKTTQLRRYEIEPGKMSEFISWFEALVIDLRKHFGFEVDWYLATESNEFLWAVSFAGSKQEFLDIESLYSESPERAKVFETYPGTITAKYVSFTTES